jgi:hypothetical protein
LFQADVEVVSYLLKEYPSAASEADEECMTPLVSLSECCV